MPRITILDFRKMTNRQLLQKIPAYGELAIRRAEEQGKERLLDSHADINLPSSALTHCFIWKLTKEGVVFWSKILDELRDKNL